MKREMQEAEGYLRHIRDCNHWNPENFRPLYIEDRRVGRLKPKMVKALSQWPNLFSVSENRVNFTSVISGMDDRTQALDEIVNALVEQGVISHSHGERYPVTASGREDAFATIDRTAAPYFGLRAYGQHLNGYVRSGEGIKLWIARRASDRKIYPGKLDNMVAGGLPQSLGLAENLQKECWEEAAVPCELALSAIPVGALTYCRETETGLKPDTLYCYDLELPEDFVPQNTDGEVEAFYLMNLEEVARIVRQTDEFKLNCNLVVIDFMIRHGFLSPGAPDYLEIVEGLHEKL